MNPVDLIVIAVIAAILGLAVWYVRRSKKKGKKCIGCPGGGCCGKPEGGCGGCSCGCK